MRTLVIAGSAQTARRWAAERQRPRDSWVYVHRPEQLLGLSNAEIITTCGWTKQIIDCDMWDRLEMLRGHFGCTVSYEPCIPADVNGRTPCHR